MVVWASSRQLAQSFYDQVANSVTSLAIVLQAAGS
jgi:hypothetical protein